MVREAHSAYGITASQWKVLCDGVYPGAQSPHDIMLALGYCKARGLDPFKGTVHLVPFWNNKTKTSTTRVMMGIAELRITAHRTDSYAGRSPTVYGEMVEANYSGVTVRHPEYAQVTVGRMLRGERHEYTAVVYWEETFNTDKDGKPNSMWCKRARGQLDKCAEAAALRMAFPEEIGEQFTSDEIGIVQQFQENTEQRAPMPRIEQAPETDTPEPPFELYFPDGELEQYMDAEAFVDAWCFNMEKSRSHDELNAMFDGGKHHMSDLGSQELIKRVNDTRDGKYDEFNKRAKKQQQKAAEPEREPDTQDDEMSSDVDPSELDD
ncbi:MAG: phage recombination protein Bet [Epibacterium sp.]|nr:phage recombination protein Bet [Epibacterium sp.]NQX73751.1 phage recombination protein Bet [Epibacterium sp.]